MKKRLLLLSISLATGGLLLFNSCSSTKPSGTYYGVLPCADCPAIHYQITFAEAATYHDESLYMGKSVSPLKESGTYLQTGNTIKLSPSNRSLLFENGKLTLLDGSGNKITGDLADRYILTSIKPTDFMKQDPSLVAFSNEQIWKLVQLNDQQVVEPRPTMTIIQNENTVAGFGGCNQYSGKASVTNQEVSFGMLVSTKKACISGDNVEPVYLPIINQATFKIEQEEGRLLLSNSKDRLIFERK